MDKVATGAKLAVLVLVVISAHFLPENGLMFDKFCDSMSKETVRSISAVPGFAITFAELQFSLLRQVCSSFIIYQIDTHVQ